MLRLAQLHLRSWHQKFITDAVRDIRRSAKEMGIQTGGTVPLPTNKNSHISLQTFSSGSINASSWLSM